MAKATLIVVRARICYQLVGAGDGLAAASYL